MNRAVTMKITNTLNLQNTTQIHSYQYEQYSHETSNTNPITMINAANYYFHEEKTEEEEMGEDLEVQTFL